MGRFFKVMYKCTKSAVFLNKNIQGDGEISGGMVKNVIYSNNNNVKNTFKENVFFDHTTSCLKKYVLSHTILSIKKQPK